jgi:hypothetical protein
MFDYSKTDKDRSSGTSVPLLSEKHSGIPEWLLDKAREAKAHALSVTTKIDSTEPRVVAYPQGIETHVFDKAIDELGKEIGTENVVLNDQPLKDGW